MNSVAAKAMLKMAKSFISPDQIKAAASELIKIAIDKKKEIQLNPEAGEVETVAIFYEAAGNAFFAIAILNADNHIIRFESVQPLETIIQSFIEKL